MPLLLGKITPYWLRSVRVQLQLAASRTKKTRPLVDDHAERTHFTVNTAWFANTRRISKLPIEGPFWPNEANAVN
jgi:hypothetical protein